MGKGENLDNNERCCVDSIVSSEECDCYKH